MLSLLQARYVAELDCEIGVNIAVDYLHDVCGYDVSSYYEELKDVSEEDFDIKNLEARDNLYHKLGIWDIMQEAYELYEKELKEVGLR